jgi:hypothetical protein
MDKAARFRRLAAVYARDAAKVTDPAHKTAYEELAEAYRLLAETLERQTLSDNEA